LAASVALTGAPKISLPPNGPYHVDGNLIRDRLNRPYLIRGTRVAPLTDNEADEKGSREAFGPALRHNADHHPPAVEYERGADSHPGAGI
jgi:hypothetical protein